MPTGSTPHRKPSKLKRKGKFEKRERPHSNHAGAARRSFVAIGRVAQVVREAAVRASRMARLHGLLAAARAGPL